MNFKGFQNVKDSFLFQELCLTAPFFPGPREHGSSKLQLSSVTACLFEFGRSLHFLCSTEGHCLDFAASGFLPPYPHTYINLSYNS